MLAYVKFMIKEKLGQKGAAMTEYAIILAFVAAIASVVFVSDSSTGLGAALKAAFNKAIEQLGGNKI